MKNITKFFHIFLFVSLILLSSLGAKAQVFQKGEELTYQVSYIGIKLGTIKIITEGAEKFNGIETYKVKAFIDSRKGIPFVDLHTIFESWIDPSFLFSRNFVGHFKSSDNIWVYDKINFDYNDNFLRMEKWKEKQLLKKTDVKTNKKWNDGMSLFFYARQYCDMGKEVYIPTIMDQDTVSTKIGFWKKREAIEIGASSYPIKTIYFNGNANWTGIYGLSGYFEGWFSDDDAHIPIKAKMKVYLGNVNIELVKWRRANWAPPKAE